MASGDDPLADMQNLIGYQGLVGQNPYLTYQGKIPMAGFYTGDAGNMPPTDAQGNPISSFVNANNSAQQQYQQAMAAYNAQPAGTTLNSMPGGASGTFDYAKMGPSGSAIQELMNNYQAAQAKLTPQQQYNQAQTRQMDTSNAQNIANLNMNRTAGGGFGAGNNVINTGPSYASPMMGAAQPAAASGRGPPPSPPDMRQAYLNALANPGPLPSYGAAPPQQGQTPTGAPPQTSGVNAFLAANTGKSTPFLNTLKQMQAG